VDHPLDDNSTSFALRIGDLTQDPNPPSASLDDMSKFMTHERTAGIRSRLIHSRRKRNVIAQREG
jgi:hypothetical protein